MKDNLLSILVRLHTTGGEALQFLGSALLSLANSTHAPLEAIVCTQHFTAEETEEVQALLDKFVWNDGCGARLVNYCNLQKKDHRSALLNAGIDAAQGRYLAFLDYDDYVYEHAYATLIRQLASGDEGAAFGGCLYAHSIRTPYGYKTTGKTNPWLRKNEADFLQDNIFPIHTFVIDRFRLGEKLPRFNEELNRLEDYDFLMRLRMETKFDLSCRGEIVAEYHLRADGTNTVLGDDPALNSKNQAEWAKARADIEPIKTLLKKKLGKT